MTLKEKFQQEPVVVYQESFILTNQSAEQLVDIADEFAIGFASWCIKKRIDFFDSTEIGETYTIDGNVSKYKMNELLEIYKKEI